MLAVAGVSSVSVAPVDSDALVQLGRNLFFDKILSGNRNIGCATCHSVNSGMDDGLPLALGEGASGAAPARQGTSISQVIPRNALSLLNAVFNPGVVFWDGRVERDPNTGALTTPEPLLNGTNPARPDLTQPLTSALAAQALSPVVNPAEMLGQPGENELASAPDNPTIWSLIMARLVGTANGTQGGIEAYRQLFQAAYPQITNFDDLTFSHAAAAIAAFERSSFAFFNAPFDQYLAGDDAALSPAAKRGAVVFYGDGRCFSCHSGPFLSDFDFHSVAVPQIGPGVVGGDDTGRALVTGNSSDLYRFRTPSLRNVDLTAPYMHDGAFTSLSDVLVHYQHPVQSLVTYTGAGLLPEIGTTLATTQDQARLASIDPVIGAGIPLTDQEISDLLEFLHSLTDPAAAVLPPAPATVPSGLSVHD
jgi:cytochrome c peroxidase